MFSPATMVSDALEKLILISLAAAMVPGCCLLCRRGQVESAGPLGDETGVEVVDTPEVRRLDDGLTTVTLRVEGSPVTAIQIWSPYGSADEPAGSTGLAELCAERLCEGLVPPPPGISTRYWATFDATVCELEAPRSLTTQLASHVGALLRAKGLPGDRSKLAASCRDVEERWRRSRSEPHRLVSEILFQTAFGEGHPYGQPVLAPPSCASMDDERIEQVCGGLLDVSHLTVTAVSAAEADVLQAALDGAPTDRRRSQARRPSPEGPAEGPRTSVVSAATKVGHVAVGFRFETLTDVERAEVEILRRILAERVRRQAVGALNAGGDETGGFVFAGREGGLLAVTIEVPPADAIRSVWEILAEAQALSGGRPSEDEVGRARLEALRDHQQARFGAVRLARSFGYDAVVGGDPTFGARLRKAISKVTAGEIGQAAALRLDPEKLAAVVILPELSQADPLELPTIDDHEGRQRLDVARLGAELARIVAGAFASPPAPRWEHLDGGLERLRGTQGQTLLVSREPSSALAAIRASVPVEVAGEGAAPRLRPAPRDPAGALTVSEQAQVLAVEGLFLKHHVAAGLRLVLQTLLDEARRRGAGSGPGALEGAAEAALDPLTTARLAVERASEPDAAGPGPSPEVPIEAVELGGRARSAGPLDELIVTVVGPCDPGDAYRALEAATPPAEATGGRAAARGPAAEAAPRREARQATELQHAHLWLAFPTRGAADPRRPELEVLAAALDAQDGQLRRRLVGEGLAFATSAELWQDARRGFLALHVETSRTNEAAVRRVLREVLDELRARPLADAEIDAARRTAAASLARGVSTATGRARAIDLAQRAGIAPSAPLAAEARALEVTAEVATRLARELFDSEHETVVVLGPEPVAAEP